MAGPHSGQAFGSEAMRDQTQWALFSLKNNTARTCLPPTFGCGDNDKIVRAGRPTRPWPAQHPRTSPTKDAVHHRGDWRPPSTRRDDAGCSSV
jgi:hypothetical protein